MATQRSQEPVIGDGSLHVGDRVVYPNQGICRITGVEVKQIAGRDWEVVTLSREEDGATVMVPRAKVMGIGLRKVADAEEIEKVFDVLASPSDDPQLDWKVRHRENADRMSGGGLFGTVEVLKGLHTLARVRPLPQKERELYDNARHLLVGEIAAAMNIPLHVAEDNLDYALWPPEGMKRKGKVLPPATLGPPAPTPIVRAEDDEDLGLDEDELAEPGETTAAAPAVAPAKEEDEEEERPEPAPRAKPEKRARPSAAGHEAEAATAEAAKARAAALEQEGAAPRAGSRAAATHKPKAPPPRIVPAARPAPGRKKAAPARKPAAEKHPPAKKPAAKKAAPKKHAAKPARPAAKSKTTAKKGRR